MKRSIGLCLALLLWATPLGAVEQPTLTLRMWSEWPEAVRIGYIAGFHQAFGLLGFRCPRTITSGEMHDVLMTQDALFADASMPMNAAAANVFIGEGCTFSSEKDWVEIRRKFQGRDTRVGPSWEIVPESR